jgi:NADH:ubiquinone oxidoreductase subunit C
MLNERFQDTISEALVEFQDALPTHIHCTRNTPDGLIIQTIPAKLRQLAFVLRNHSLLLFRHLVEVAVVDRLISAGRFVVSYIFLSYTGNQRIVLQVAAGETSILPSLASVFTNGQRFFSAARWLEREI